ncbi:MAG: hypothetical protein ACI3Y0_10350 [Prevotella sp.]
MSAYKSILNADNRTKMSFYKFLDHRYGFSANHALQPELIEELDKLDEIHLLLIEGIEDKTLIDKRLINMIITAIIKIITQK